MTKHDEALAAYDEYIGTIKALAVTDPHEHRLRTTIQWAADRHMDRARRLAAEARAEHEALEAEFSA